MGAGSVGTASAEAAGSAESGALASGSGVDESERATRRAAMRQLQQQRWSRVRESLFADIDLSAEQSAEIDAIVEAEWRGRARFQELVEEIKGEQKQPQEERDEALLAEVRALKRERRERHEMLDEMRALLTEEQRPAFDMNRAHLLAKRAEQRDTGRANRVRSLGAAPSEGPVE
jgi:hypothetical protein